MLFRSPEPRSFKYVLRDVQITCTIPSERCTGGPSSGTLVSQNGAFTYEAHLTGIGGGTIAVTDTHDMSFFGRPNVIDKYQSGWESMPSEIAPDQKYNVSLKTAVEAGSREGVSISEGNFTIVTKIAGLYDELVRVDTESPSGMNNNFNPARSDGSYVFHLNPYVVDAARKDLAGLDRLPKQKTLSVVLGTPTGSNPITDGFTVIYTYDLVVAP